MRQEIGSAVDFLSNILTNRNICPNKVQTFAQNLEVLMCSHYQNHWFPEKPFKGSGYRCIRINHKMDPLLAKAGAQCGMHTNQLFDLFPSELTVWVDPREVSYRIGEDGSIGVLYNLPNSQTQESYEGHQIHTPTTNSASSSPSSTPPPMMIDNSSPTPMVPSSTLSYEFLQSCKDQLRYYLPESSSEPLNFESYLSTFVAS